MTFKIKIKLESQDKKLLFLAVFVRARGLILEISMENDRYSALGNDKSYIKGHRKPYAFKTVKYLWNAVALTAQKVTKFFFCPKLNLATNCRDSRHNFRN